MVRHYCGSLMHYCKKNDVQGAIRCINKKRFVSNDYSLHFIMSCQRGCFSIVKWLWEMSKYDENTLSEALYISCENRKKNIVEFLLNNHKYDNDVLQNSLEITMKHLDIDIIQMIYNYGEFDDKTSIEIYKKIISIPYVFPNIKYIIFLSKLHDKIYDICELNENEHNNIHTIFRIILNRIHFGSNLYKFIESKSLVFKSPYQLNKFMMNILHDIMLKQKYHKLYRYEELFGKFEKECYIIGLIEILDFHQIVDNPMFDIEVFTQEVWKYLILK